MSHPDRFYFNWHRGRQYPSCRQLHALSKSYNLTTGNFILTTQEITVFNVNFPSDSSSIKFRAVQWICTEFMLALAVFVNFLPRESTPPITKSYSDSRKSSPLQVHLLLVELICSLGLHLEPRLATNRHSKHLRISHCSWSFHDDLQWHRCSSSMELVSVVSCNCWHFDRLRCVWSCGWRNEERFCECCQGNILEYCCQWNWRIPDDYPVPVLCGKNPSMCSIECDAEVRSLARMFSFLSARLNHSSLSTQSFLERGVMYSWTSSVSLLCGLYVSSELYLFPR